MALCLPGTGVAAQSEEPPPQVLETLKDWTLACVPASGEGPARCELFQEMTVRETGQRVFRLAIRLAKDGAVEASALAPFGLQLRAGITYSIDGGAPFVSDFLTCFASGCLSRFVVPEDILAALEAGTWLVAEMDVYEGERFRVQLALPGLSEGLVRLRTLAQQ